MNNLIKVAMMALAFASFSMAEGLSVGGHVSGAYSAFWGEDEADDYWGPGFNVGASVRIPLSSVIAFTPEVAFAYRSASDNESGSETYDGETYYYDTDITFSQINIDIPLLFRFDIVSGLFLEAGPLASVNLDTDIEYSGDGDSESSDVDQNLIEFGVIAGVGYSVTPKIDIDARFALGLTKLYDKLYDDNKVDMKSFMFHLGGTFWFM